MTGVASSGPLSSSAILLGAAALLLAACGGGGSDSSSDGVSFLRGAGPGNPAGCPTSQFSDTWINNRLGCLVVGQQFIKLSAVGTGAVADRAYALAQQVYDTNLNYYPGGDTRRWFSYFLCVRNAPEKIDTLDLSIDAASALGIGNPFYETAYLPRGVSASSLDIKVNVSSAVIVTPCEQSKHPIIVDYATGNVQSINSAALAALQIVDR